MEMNISQPKINNEINSERIANANFRVLVNIQKLIEHLEETKLESTSKEIADLFDQQQPLSYLSLIALQSYSCFISQKKDAKLYLNLFKQIDTLLKDKTEYKIIKFFSEYLYDLESNESNYLLNQMIEEHLIEPEFVMKKDTFYFAHYKPKDCLTSYQNILNFEELIKDDYKLHKEKIKEGYNPTEIAKIIRLDNVEELQKISSETNFNFNQSIIPSPYERYSFVTKRRVMTRFGFVGEDVKLCDYAAFYGSLECFKFLLLNGANVSNSGKYAVAGGSTEILYLCEQNNATFKSAFNAAIEFHQKKIFDYLYNKKPEEFQKIINDLGDSCVVNNNFIILDFLLDKGLNKETILKSSIENGNFYLVQYILEGKQIPQELFPITANPINHEILKQSLDKGGININYVLEEDGGKYTALIIAAQKCRVKNCELLLKCDGIDINFPGDRGLTSFFFACIEGKKDLIQLFLDNKNTEIDYKTAGGITPFMCACAFGNLDAVKMLIEQKGVDINAKTNSGETAFTQAIMNDRVEVVKFLYNLKEIDTTTKDSEEVGLLMFAFKNKAPKVVKFLLEQKDKNYMPKLEHGSTLLMFASQYGSVEIVKMLLEQKIDDVNAKTDNGYTALILASRNGNDDVVKCLLKEKDIDVNIQTSTGYTALIWACFCGMYEVAELLINDERTNLNLKNQNGNTALFGLALDDHTLFSYMFQVLNTIDTTQNDGQGGWGLPGVRTCEMARIEILKILLKRKDLDINMICEDGFTALMAACKSGSYEIVDLLLKQPNIDVNIQGGYKIYIIYLKLL